MTEGEGPCLPPYVEDGITYYPVRHAFGAIVCSFTPESQKLWQDYANQQRAQLEAMMEKRGK